MIKLLCGPLNRAAWEAFGRLPVYNWTAWEQICLEVRNAGKVWPMVLYTSSPLEQPVIDLRPNYVLWHNEPDPASLDATALAPKLSAFQHPGPVHIVGNVLIQYPYTPSWATIRTPVLSFLDRLAALGWNVVLGVHLYRLDLPDGSLSSAIDWFGQQIYDIRRDVPLVAVTEWGVLRSLYRGGNGPDVPLLADYMQQAWQIMLDYNIYAACWFISQTTETKWREADITLASPGGLLRPLGVVYRDLPTGDIPQPPEPTDPERWMTVYEDAAYRLQRRGA